MDSVAEPAENATIMETSRRRELKKIGKQLVQEKSEEVREQLAERNPWPVGHPNWVSNLQAEYKTNRKYRKNTLQVLKEATVIGDADLKLLGFDFEDGFVPHKGWYILCHACRELVPTACSHVMGCKCRAVVISPEARQVRLPIIANYSVVELIGRGPINAD